MVEPSRKKELRQDACFVLGRVGRKLQTAPGDSRDLRLIADRFPRLAQYIGDDDLVFFASYLKGLVDDLWFNIATENSARLVEEERNGLIAQIGLLLVRLSKALSKKDAQSAYRYYMQFGKVWSRVPEIKEDLTQISKRKAYQISKTFHNELDRGIARSTVWCANLLSSGRPSPWNVDMDTLLYNPKDSKMLAKAYVRKITEMRKRKISIDRLGFIDKAYGPIGAIALASSIVSDTGISANIIRLRRRTPVGEIKGPPLKKNQSVLIVSDVLTTADGILQASNVVKKRAKVSHALVLLDREQGGGEKLEELGIRVEAIRTRSDLKYPGKKLVDVSDALAASIESE